MFHKEPNQTKLTQNERDGCSFRQPESIPLFKHETERADPEI